MIRSMNHPTVHHHIGKELRSAWSPAYHIRLRTASILRVLRMIEIMADTIFILIDSHFKTGTLNIADTVKLVYCLISDKSHPRRNILQNGFQMYHFGCFHRCIRTTGTTFLVDIL